LQKPVYITAIGSVSPLGLTAQESWDSYFSDDSPFTSRDFNGKILPLAPLTAEGDALLDSIRHSDPKYKNLDRSVLLAVAASRKAMEAAGWNAGNIGVNIGSSRGATTLFEQYHQQFVTTGTTGTLASPTTTLGNIASWVAHDLKTSGPDISHSITCSTALHALLNGMAWLRSGMADAFLAGGSEAPLTPFTIAQMQAMKIYSKESGKFPCHALDFDKKQNTMVLGEAASVCALSPDKKNALAVVESIGYATEILQHPVSISAEAECFQKSMDMALAGIDSNEIDAIVMHAPGTIAGDLSEYKAIQKTFGEKLPLLTSTKWKTGHTFGASGMLSVELAVMMLQREAFVGSPFLTQETDRPLRKILVNAVGFGGNAVSVLLSRP